MEKKNVHPSFLRTSIWNSVVLKFKTDHRWESAKNCCKISVGLQFFSQQHPQFQILNHKNSKVNLPESRHRVRIVRRLQDNSIVTVCLRCDRWSESLPEIHPEVRRRNFPSLAECCCPIQALQVRLKIKQLENYVSQVYRNDISQ